MKISQSFIKDYHSNECKYFVKQKYVDQNPLCESVTDAMLKGQYFEQQLIGRNRSGKVVEMPKGAKGQLLADEIRLNELAEAGKLLMQKMGIEIVEVQKTIEHEDLVGHLDIDATYKGRRVTIDVKYTDTKIDDRWNGWADIENKDHLQPVHYTYLEYKKTGEFKPFYYLIFGKSGWVRFVQVAIGKERFASHEYSLSVFRDTIKREKWQAAPEFNRCLECPLLNFCQHAAKTPQIELITI